MSPDESIAADADGQQKNKKQVESTYYSLIGRVGADGRMMVGPDIEIFPSRECPAFASAPVKAYEAKDRRQTGDQVALICEHQSLPRVTHIGSYKGIKSPHLMNLHEAGVVNWPTDGRQKFAFIFDKPPGRKLLESPDGEVYKIAEDKLIPMMVEPIVKLLVEFRNVELVHGAINLENIYVVGAEGAESIVLGECISTARGLRQHPFYEVQSRAVAQPSGRGFATIADDLYALGVCVAMVARGENLMRGKTGQQIIHEKLVEGSFATIIGKERIPSGVTEFLRGVLSDDESQRWGVEEVLTWLEGRRLSPKQGRVMLKAARPLSFRDGKYWDLKSLAQAFSESVVEAAAEVEKGQFEVWIKRNFEDNGLEARLKRVMEKERDGGHERFLSCICMALDPMAPVRYKGLALFPSGFGTALALATARGDDIQVYGDLLHQQLFNAWVSQSFEEIPDAAGTLALLEKCRSALTQRMPGYGLERIIYMLNLEAPCLSPLLRNHFVLSPGGLLLALEDISKQAARPENVLDRHMVAFIAVREPKMIETHFGYVNSSNRGQQVIGVIRTLAAIQRRFAVDSVPGLCNWMISLTAPMIDLLHDRDLRAAVTKKVNALQGSGNLTTLLDLVDDPILIREDAQRFAYAQQEYAMLSVERGRIQSNLTHGKKQLGRATGRQVAMFISCTVSFIVIVGYVILRFMKLI